MSVWTSPFNFGIFYTAVYVKNTNQYQYNVVNILFQGEHVYGQDMASKYCRNQIAISGDRVFEYSNLSDEQVMERINGSGITDMGVAVRTLVALLNSEYIEMDGAERNAMLTCAAQEEGLRFLTKMLRVALGCPKARLKKLTREMKSDILACRERADKKETEEKIVAVPSVLNVVTSVLLLGIFFFLPEEFVTLRNTCKMGIVNILPSVSFFVFVSIDCSVKGFFGIPFPVVPFISGDDS